MNPPAAAIRSPAVELAETLVPALVAAGLLRDTVADRAEAFQYLTSGTSRPEDWRRLLERIDEPLPKPSAPADKAVSVSQVAPATPAAPRPQPPAPIDWLEVSHFRGIGQARWKLPLGGERLVVLTGENGAGKSSILDALDVALRRIPGSVADRFDGAEPPELLRYLPALGKQPADVLLRVQLKNGACWEARLEEELDEAPAGSLSDEEEPTDETAGLGRLSIVVKRPIKVSQAALPHVRVLRRQQLLGLLEANQAEQFNQIRSFIGLKPIESVEGSIRTLLVALENETDTASNDREVTSRQAATSKAALNYFEEYVNANPPLTNDSGAMAELGRLREGYCEAEKKSQEAEHNLHSINSLAQAAASVTDLILSHRHLYTNKILGSVTEKAKTYYSVIHPGENLGPTSWQIFGQDQICLDSHYRGHQNVTPQAYFSESHLDTLGFCYWLALARHAAPNGQAILLLDDVFTSADAPHLRRVTELLAAEVKAKRFLQVIITTHNPLWETFFKRGGASVRALRLYATAPDNVGGSTLGIVPNRTYADEVRAELDHCPFDPVTAAAKAGILLERLYDEVALLYAVNLPRKATGYTLNDFGPVRTKLAALTVERTAPDPSNPKPKSLAEACTALHQNEFIRNAKGAHYNPLGELLAETDARTFAEAVLTLADLLRCPHCRKAPDTADGRQFSCGCDQPTYLWPMPTR